MSKQAHLPDGTILEFPDNTPDAVMDGVVKQHLSQAPAANNSGFAQMVSSAPHPDKIAQAKTFLRQLPGMGEVADYIDAFQHHAMGALHGTAQLAEHGTNAITGGVIQDTVNQDDAALRQMEADYQARTPDSAGAYAGAAVGEVAPWMTGIGELRALGLLPKLSAATTTGGKVANAAAKVGLLAAQGAAMGATAPVTGNGSYADQKAAQVATGAIAAPLTAGVLKTTGAATRLIGAGARYLTPAGREVIANARVGRLLGNDPATEAALRQPSNIPGFQPTPAQAIGTPEAVQAERVLRNNGLTAPAFANRESANNAAMRTHVAGVAGTDATLQAAIDNRRAMTQTFIQANLGTSTPQARFGNAVKSLTDSLAKRPQMLRTDYDAMEKARIIATRVLRGGDEGDAVKQLQALNVKNGYAQKAINDAITHIDKGLVNPTPVIRSLQNLASSSLGVDPAVDGGINHIIGQIAKHQNERGLIGADMLDGIRQNVREILKKYASNGAVSTKQEAAFVPIKSQIIRTLERSVPGYRNYLAAYAHHSQPINDMEAGRALLGAIDSGGRDAGGNQTVSLNQVKALLAKDNRANFPMSPGARAQIESVLEALQRRTISHNTIAATGPGSAADIQRAVQASPLLMRMLGHGAAGVGGIFGGLPGLLAGAGTVEGANALNNVVTRRVGVKAANAQLAADALAANRLRLARPKNGLARLGLPYDQQ